MSPSVAVVGGGVSGLAAAHRLRTMLGPDAQITVLEAGDRLGGALKTIEFAGKWFDVGAEAFVRRRPEVPTLLGELGLSERVMSPTPRQALIRAGGRLHPLPRPTLMGIPAGVDAVRGVVGPSDCSVIEDEPARPLAWDASEDMDVATLVGGRYGDVVVHRCVDPLLGGVYSGSAASIGVRAGVPALAAALDSGARSLTEAIERAMPTPVSGPVFGAIDGGYRMLIEALVEQSGARIALEAPVSAAHRDGDGWWVDQVGHVDGVVLAVPAPALARLLGAVDAAAGWAAAGIPVASSAVVALAVPATASLPENSGVLVASDESLRAKAFTFSGRKWPHLDDPDLQLVRVSLGRFGDESPLPAADDELIGAACTDLALVTGMDAEPVVAQVQRWNAGLPQYGPGHLERVRVLETTASTSPGLALAGSALHGVGVPACIGTARDAAEKVARDLL